MPMTGSAMKSVVTSAISSLTDAQKADHDAIWTAICNAIVTYIQTNAQVAVVSVSGVTTGPGVSGPGVGTIL